MMLPEHGPGIIVKLKLLSCKKNSSLLDASFHMSVNGSRGHPRGRFGRKSLPKLADFSLS